MNRWSRHSQLQRPTIDQHTLKLPTSWRTGRRDNRHVRARTRHPANNRALDAFASHGIGVTLPDIGPHQQGPGFYLLRFRPRPGVTTASIEARVADIKLALELTVDQDIRHYIDRGAVVFEVPKSPEQRFDVDAEQMWTDADWHEDALFAPIGRDITGSVVGINFSSSTTPHLLIAGTTGSGKSVALETILMGLCRQHEAASLRLHLIDPKGTELLRFEDADHTEGEIGYDAEDAVEALSNMVDEMQDRYRRFKEISRHPGRQRPLTPGLQQPS